MAGIGTNLENVVVAVHEPRLHVEPRRDHDGLGLGLGVLRELGG